MRYVLIFCLKPLLLMGVGCGCGGAGACAGPNAGTGAFLLRLRFTGRVHSSGSQINMEP